MTKPINSDLKHRTANILRNDRVSLTNTTNLDNHGKFSPLNNGETIERPLYECCNNISSLLEFYIKYICIKSEKKDIFNNGLIQEKQFTFSYSLSISLIRLTL